MRDQSSFLTDIKTIRDRARHHVERGAMTEGYRGNRETVLRLLNEALATELVCVLRYRQHFHAASGYKGELIKAELLEHATDEALHAERIAERITQLGGVPNYSPEGLQSRSHSEYVEGRSLKEMLREDLVAERIAVQSYSEIIRYIGENDPTTRILLEEILAKEEEHATDLSTLLADFAG
jgi:bacterioferritin